MLAGAAHRRGGDRRAADAVREGRHAPRGGLCGRLRRKAPRSSSPPSTTRSSATATHRARTGRLRRILADFAIVRVDSLRGWQGFRDVVEVDGRASRDRDDRLVRLLTESGGRYDEARRLSDESARFNIGRIQRNFNVPTTALFFFTTDNLDRFKFTAKGVDRATASGRSRFAKPSRPTADSHAERRDRCRPEGTLWVNPVGRDGRAHAARGRRVRRSRDRAASHGHRPGRRHLPARRRARHVAARVDGRGVRSACAGNSRDNITGRALYSNYRQFQTIGANQMKLEGADSRC